MGTSRPTCQLPAAGADLRLPIGICGERSHSLIQKLHGASSAYFVESRCLCLVSPDSQPGLALPSFCSSLTFPNTCAVLPRLSLHLHPQTVLTLVSPAAGVPTLSPAHPPPEPTYLPRSSRKDSPITLATSCHVSFLRTPRRHHSSRPCIVLCSPVSLTALSNPRGQGPFLEALLNSVVGNYIIVLQIPRGVVGLLHDSFVSFVNWDHIMTSSHLLCCRDGVLDLTPVVRQPASRQVFLRDYFCAQHMMFKPSPEGYAEINLVRGWEPWRVLCMWAATKPSAEATKPVCDGLKQVASVKGVMPQPRRPRREPGDGGGSCDSRVAWPGLHCQGGEREPLMSAGGGWWRATGTTLQEQRHNS